MEVDPLAEFRLPTESSCYVCKALRALSAEDAAKLRKALAAKGDVSPREIVAWAEKREQPVTVTSVQNHRTNHAGS